MRVVGKPKSSPCLLPQERVGNRGDRGETDVVGSATFPIGRDPTNCEFATTVAGDYVGLGLGLAKNQPMLRLAARLGFSISSHPDDPAVRICRLQLADC